MNVLLLIFGGCLCVLAVAAHDPDHVLVKRSGIFRSASPSSRPSSPSVRRTSGKDAIGQEAHGTVHGDGTVSSGYLAKGGNAWQSPPREGQGNSLKNPAESHTKYKDDSPKQKKKGFFGGSSSSSKKNKGKGRK